MLSRVLLSISKSTIENGGLKQLTQAGKHTHTHSVFVFDHLAPPAHPVFLI